MMTGKNDDAAHTREDSFLAELIPQAAERLVEQRAGEFDAEAGRARFLTWLTAHTRKPAAAAKVRTGSGYARPRRTGRAKRFSTWAPAARPAGLVPDGRFLGWLSGAQRQILAECPTERPRYVGLGAAILISAVMAGVSLAFVLVTALNAALWVALPLALAWGVAIMSLNRLFVVSLSRGRFQLFRAIPRLLMALLMGVVISTPLVLQIFRPEIQHQITVLHDQAATAYYEQASTSPLARQIAADQAKVNQELIALGHAQSGEQEAALRQEVSASEQELRADQAALQQQASAFTMTNQGNTGLLIRLQALHAITADNPVLATAWWLLVALLVLIDCTPILIKMLLNLSPPSIYERILADEEETQLTVAEHNMRMRREIQMRAAKATEAAERSRLAALSAPLPEITENIIAARRRVEGEWLRRWEADQMQRLATERTTSRAQGSQPAPSAAEPSPTVSAEALIWQQSPDPQPTEPEEPERTFSRGDVET